MIQNGKFMGGLKYLIEDRKVSEQNAKELIKEGKWTLVPCGQCLQCRLRAADNWATRIELESKYVENSHFITLTYNDQSLPVHNMIEDTHYHGLANPEEYLRGRSIERGTLVKKDLQDFMKRLRIQAQRKGLIEDQPDGLGIRFFACGEYGDINRRPHFHCIIFGLKIPDLKLKYRFKGYEHDYSKWLEEDIWGQGIVDIGSCTYESARYTARYIVKKQKGENAKLYEKAGIAPEFLQMSLKPGIGQRAWADNREEYYPRDVIYLSSGHRSRPPRYFDNLEDKARIAEEHNEEMQEIGEKIDIEEQIGKVESEYMKDIRRARRKRANDALFNKLRATSGTTITEYFDIIGQKYEAQHTTAKDRGRIDRSTG